MRRDRRQRCDGRPSEAALRHAGCRHDTDERAVPVAAESKRDQAPVRDEENIRRHQRRRRRALAVRTRTGRYAAAAARQRRRQDDHCRGEPARVVCSGGARADIMADSSPWAS